MMTCHPRPHGMAQPVAAYCRASSLRSSRSHLFHAPRTTLGERLLDMYGCGIYCVPPRTSNRDCPKFSRWSACAVGCPDSLLHPTHQSRACNRHIPPIIRQSVSSPVPGRACLPRETWVHGRWEFVSFTAPVRLARCLLRLSLPCLHPSCRPLRPGASRPCLANDASRLLLGQYTVLSGFQL